MAKKKKTAPRRRVARHRRLTPHQELRRQIAQVALRVEEVDQRLTELLAQRDYAPPELLRRLKRVVQHLREIK